MDPISVFILAVGLAMDSFAVSICGGMTMNPIRIRHALRIAAFFGLFQTLMPVIGWLGGLGFQGLIASYDHWVAFGLLAFIGGKMIYEASKGDSCARELDIAGIPLLLVLSLATSIDALAVGLSFAFLGVSIIIPVIVIGLITAALSLGGVFLGKRYGSLFQSRAQIMGGLILIGIGIKILIEHLSAAAPMTIA